MKKKIFIYGIVCLFLYAIPAWITSMSSFNNNENMAMLQAGGYGIVINIIVTVIFRNFFMYIFNIKNNYIKGENIFNALCALSSSGLLYMLLISKELSGDLPVLIVIIYLIFSFLGIKLGMNINNGSSCLEILKSQSKGIGKFKYFIFPSAFVLLWLVPVIIFCMVLSEKINNNPTEFLIIPHIYAIIIGYIYQKINGKISAKYILNDSSVSLVGRMYYELFLYLFFLVYFSATCIIRNKFTNMNDILIPSSFLIVIVPCFLLKILSFDGYYASGKIPKQEKIKAFTLNFGNYSETTIIDENGNETKAKSYKIGKNYTATDIEHSDGSVTKVDNFKF